MKKLISSASLVFLVNGIMVQPGMVFAAETAVNEPETAAVEEQQPVAEQPSQAVPEKPEQKEQEAQGSTESQAAAPQDQKGQDKNWLEELLPEEKEGAPQALLSLMEETPAPPKPTIKNDPMKFMKGLDGEYETDLFTGAATYKLPLWIPEGRGKVTPKVLLSYASTNNRLDTLVGQGWTLGVSSIYRNTAKGIDKLYSQDDFASEVFGNYKELISVDGANGIYGGKTETDFAKYEYANGAWVMTDKEGTKYFFGSDADHRQQDPNNSNRIFKWLLQKIEDRNGNIAAFDYFFDGEQAYPETIKYSGYGNDPGIYEIQFHHTLRDNPVTSALSGYFITTAYLIDRIDVYVNLQDLNLVRTYELTQENNNNVQPLLTKVTLKSGEEALPPIQFTYFEGNENAQLKTKNLLEKVEYPAGGIQEITYQLSTAYRTPSQGISNVSLPFSIPTVKEAKLKTSANDSANIYAYDYSGGHYYYDSMDAYKKEYAGFHEVTITDPVDNVRKIFFHQSEFAQDNGQSSSYGEYEDHIAKKGKIYREENYDDAEHLYAAVIRKWDKSTLTDDNPDKERFFPFLKREVRVTYDGDSSTKTTAVENSYGDYGNLSEVVDYGEVSLSGDDGSFSDTGSDKITTSYEYAVNTSDYVVGLQKRKTARDENNNLFAEEKIYYDGQGTLGQVDKGNPTKTETLKDNQNNYITTEAEYNSYGLMTTYTNARNYDTNITYDTYNVFPASITNAKSQATEYDYDNNGPFGYGYAIATYTEDPNNSKTVTTLDGLGRVTEVKVSEPTDPNSLTPLTTYGYDTQNYPHSVTQTQSSGYYSVITKTYLDGFNRPIQSKKEAEGNDQYIVTSTTYDELGRIKKEFLPQFTTGDSFEATNSSDPGMAYTYDAMNRPLTLVNTLGTTTITYNDWTKTVEDPNGKTKDYRYDARNNLVEVKEYLNSNPYATVYAYDPLGNLIQITDALGNVRHFTYDFLKHKLTQEDLHTSGDASYGTWVYTYDNNGNRLTQTDPKSNTITLTYDELDRLLTENYNSSGPPEIEYSYDQATNGIGRLWKIFNVNGVKKEFEYDILGRVSMEKKTINTVNYITNFTWDRLGMPRTVQTPDSMVVTSYYDNAGQLELVTINGVGDIITDIDYSPAGTPTQIDYANGVTTANTYDDQQLWRLTNKLTTHNSDTLQDISYEYDSVGNITDITDASDHDGAKTAAYGYDDLYRLTSATITNTANSQDYTHEYTYDIIGNVLTRTDVTGTYVYDGNDNGTSSGTMAGPHAVTGIDSTTYEYDWNGNLTSDGTWTYTWDQKDWLIGATDGTTTLEYAYDESGERAIKNNQTTSTQTLYMNRYYELNATVPHTHIYAGDLKVATVEDGTDVIYHHSDHLTGTNVDTDESGAVLEVLDYYPYGNVRLDDKTGTYENAYKYTGKELDEETDLYYYGARYYNAAIGRFVSQDPWGGDIKDPQTLNKYSYVRNNPLKYTDPTGMTFTGQFTKQEIITFEKTYASGSYGPYSQKYERYLSMRNQMATLLGPTSLFEILTDTKEKQNARNYLTNYEGADLSSFSNEDYYHHAMEIEKGYINNIATYAAAFSGDVTYNNISWDHILQNHGVNSTATYKSKFYTNSKDVIQGYIDDAVNSVKPVKQGSSDYVYEKSFTQNIGIDPSGNPTSTLRVVKRVDSSSGQSSIVTAYPLKK